MHNENDGYASTEGTINGLPAYVPSDPEKRARFEAAEHTTESRSTFGVTADGIPCYVQGKE